MTPLTVGKMLERMTSVLALELIGESDGLEREIRTPNVSSPGLVLAGYVERFPAQRMQVLGETEITYLKSLDPEMRRRNLEMFFSFPIPCVFITKGQKPGTDLVELASKARVPLI